MRAYDGSKFPFPKDSDIHLEQKRVAQFCESSLMVMRAASDISVLNLL